MTDSSITIVNVVKGCAERGEKLLLLSNMKVAKRSRTEWVFSNVKNSWRPRPAAVMVAAVAFSILLRYGLKAGC